MEFASHDAERQARRGLEQQVRLLEQELSQRLLLRLPPPQRLPRLCRARGEARPLEREARPTRLLRARH